MQIDRKALEGLLSLNDRQLMTIINKLMAEGGLDPTQLNINMNDISSIRSKISGASDAELESIVNQFQNNLKKGQKK